MLPAFSQMSYITGKNVTFKYPKTEALVLDDISFNIEKGSYTAIVGFNGCGKSTLSRLICGLEIPLSGSIEVEENCRIGIVFQSPKNQIVSSIVYRDTAFGPQNQKLPASEIELRSIECLNIVDLLDHAQSGTAELSLGQVQKTALAGMLACDTDVLILDEALSMIDPQTRSDILDFLKYWHNKGKTIIHITHETEALRDVNSIIAMRKGKIFFSGSREEFFSNKEYLLMLQGESLKKTSKQALVKKADKKVSLRLSDINFDYNEKYGIHNVSFELYKGTITALTGESGAGKSTILEIAAGLNSNAGGNIYACKMPVLAQQNAASALFEAFAADDVAFGPKNMGIENKDLLETVKKSMDLAGLPFDLFKERHTFELSGGEQRRLSIAGIIALNADVLFFDEPSAGLDSPSRNQLFKMFRELSQQGKTILFSTHHQDEIDFADREIRIESGRLVYDSCSLGSKAFVPATDDPGLEKLKKIESASILDNLRKATSSVAGTHLPKKSVLLKIPAFLRILIFLGLFITSLLIEGPLWCTGLFAITLLYTFFAGFKLKKLLLNFLRILPFLGFFALLQMIFKAPLPDEVPLVSWKWFTITPSKLFFSLESLLRTYSTIACICAFFVSTPEYDLIDGLKILLWPFEKIKLPVRYLILILEVIFRFIPLLIEETACIIKTQIIRGSMKSVKGLVAKIKALVPLFVPVIIQTIKRSEALADAITMRGF